jgi:hypothetical protein
MNKILELYEVLLGIEESIDYQDEVIDVIFIQQYNRTIDEIIDATKDDFIVRYKIQQNMINTYNYCFKGCLKKEVIMFIKPLKKYLEKKYVPKKVNEEQINDLYDSLSNIDLKERCIDLISAENHFDRVFNQATQVLENSIKNKANLSNTKLIGMNLVSKAIHSKLDQTILVFSNDESEQEAWAALFKGIIGVYRNPSHHGLKFECTREDAIKFCSYVDLLIKELNKCSVNEK